MDARAPGLADAIASAAVPRIGIDVRVAIHRTRPAHEIDELAAGEARVARLRELSDVDTMADAVKVAALVPDGRFGRELRGSLVPG